jgi:glycosyltransferase involved in cell wall biosynthesis
MTFKILISTTDDKFLDRAYVPPADHIIVNQLLNKEKSAYSKANFFSYQEKGLSKSRNRAIKHCDSDIALISDDDVDYFENVQEIVIKAFEKNPDADIITFQFLKDDNTLYKTNYKKETFWHDLYTLARVSSVEIAFKVDKIKNLNIYYDEQFGLGSTFPTGEEYIFLSDAFKKGLKILYVPVPILIHKEISSGGQFLNNDALIESKGALFFRIFGSKAYLISLVFAFRKYKLSNVGFIKFYKLMLDGISKYKEKLND